jgi:type I restriction enzyme, S subunit
MKEEQTINELPKDWKWVKLGDFAFVTKLAGFEFTKYVSYNENGDIPVIRAQNVTKNGFLEKNLIYVDRETMEKLPRSRVYGGEILMVFVGSIGNVGLVPTGREYFLGPNVAKIVVEKEFYNKYILYFLSSQVALKNVSALSKATTQASISMTNIRDVNVPFTSISNQQQIVSKIEELFSELDKGIEELKTAQQQLKVYRQAVLKWAFEGKLTNEDLKDGESPEGWKNATIGDICTSVEYGSATKSNATGKIPVLRMGNIQNGIFDWEDLVYTDDEEEINKYLLRKNDVLFNRTNSAELVGKTAIYKGEKPAIFAGYLIRINRIEDKIDANYLTYYLNSKQAKSYGNSVRSFGVNQSNINGTKLKTYPLPLPPLEEQQQIVQEIESRLSVCDKIEETITASLKQAEALRQSILKKAFEGNLIFETVCND